MKKLIIFVFLFSFFAAGIILTPNVSYAQTQGQTSSQNQTALQAEFNAKMSQIDSMSGAQADNAYHALINDAKYTSIIQANPTMYSGSSLQNYDYSNAKVSDATKEKLAGITNLNEEDANGNKVHGALIDELIAKGEYDAVRDAERAQVDMRKNGTTQEEAEKFVAEDREKKRQELAEAQARANCSKGDSNFTKYLLSYVGSGGGNFCWFCPMFEGLFDAMNNLATAISVKMADVFLMIMGVGLLFSIAFKVAKMVTSLQGADLMQFLTDMFKHLGRAIIATVLLVSSLSIFTYLVSPVLTMSMSLSSVIMDEGGGRGAVIKASQATGIKAGSICDDLADQLKVSTSVEDQKKAFTPEVKASFICALRTMSAGLIFGVILGVVIYSLAFTKMIWNVLPNIQYALLGLIIVIGHLAILITFPFKLIDSMIRMAFVTALMPLWIILWVFPATVGYTKKAWDLFLSSCLIFVCLSVVITLVMTIMQYAIPNREEIISLLTCGFDEAAAAKIPIGGKELLVTAALTFLGWKMLGTATTLASSFVGAIPDLGIGQSINETTVKGAKFTGKAARAGGRAFANSKAGQKLGQKLHMDSKKAAKLGALGAYGIATGIAPLMAAGAAAYGLFRGGQAAINKFRGGGSGGAQGGGGSQGGGGAPTTPPTGGSQGGAPNTPPQNPTGTPQNGAPNTPPNGGPQGGTPNMPAPGGAQGETPTTGGTPQGTPSMPTPAVPGKSGTTPAFVAGGQGAAATHNFVGNGNNASIPTTTGTGNVNEEPVAPQGATTTGGSGTSETMSFGPSAQTTGATTTTTGSTTASTSAPTEAMTFNAGSASGSVTSSSDTQTANTGMAAGTDASAGAVTGTATGAAADNKASDNGQSGATDSVARNMAQRASAEARSAAASVEAIKKGNKKDDNKVESSIKSAQSKADQADMKASNAQAAAAQALSEASKKDKDDNKKNKPE